MVTGTLAVLATLPTGALLAGVFLVSDLALIGLPVANLALAGLDLLVALTAFWCHSCHENWIWLWPEPTWQTLCSTSSA